MRLDPLSGLGDDAVHYVSDDERGETFGSGDPLLGQLYDRYFARLLSNLSRKFGPGPPEPRDIAQQAFLKVAERGNYEDLRNPENFVWITACNIMLGEKRSQATRLKHSDQPQGVQLSAWRDELDPSRVLEGREGLDIVMSELAKMPERRRTIFLLNRVDGLTPQQAGERCGVSRTSAVRHIAIATRALTRALSDRGSSDEPERDRT